MIKDVSKHYKFDTDFQNALNKIQMYYRDKEHLNLSETQIVEKAVLMLYAKTQAKR